MKIALVRARFNPFGGAEQFAARAIRALAGKGSEVTIIARRWDAATGSEEAVKMRWIRCDPFYIGSVWRDWSFARAVMRVIQREQFDLVQSHERIPGLPIYRAGDGVHACWLERRRAVSGTLARWGLRLNPHHRFLCRVERIMFEHADLKAVICNSRMVRDEISTHFRIAPDKLHLVPNGVDLEHFQPDMASQYRTDMRRKLAIASSVTVFVLVGSGFARKGVEMALHALAVQQDNRARLVVVGGDKHASRYAALARELGIADRVHFVGPQKDTLPYYGLADAFILPTIYDPFPNAALEALACGLPVITTDGCGVKEMIVEGENGWICGVGDRPALACAMAAYTSLGEPQRDEMRARARASAQPYSLDALADALIGLYRRLQDQS